MSRDAQAWLFPEMKPSKEAAEIEKQRIKEEKLQLARDVLQRLEQMAPKLHGIERFYWYEEPSLGVQYTQRDDLFKSLNVRLIQDDNNPKRFKIKTFDGAIELLDSLFKIMKSEFESQGLELTAEISKGEKLRLHHEIKKTKHHET